LTQRIRDRENGIIAIRVIPNRELIALISSFGSDVEVIEPQNLRGEMAQHAALLNEKYCSVQIGFTPMR
jgi:predicted DNA-binding transcriptional regulator YafY